MRRVLSCVGAVLAAAVLVAGSAGSASAAPSCATPSEAVTAMNVVRWLVVGFVCALVIGLFAYARGPEHHHGQYVGSLGDPDVVLTEG